jgi:uracil-DNA glycosylase
MDAAYDQLLTATITHLEDLKSRGVKHLPVAPDSLANLAQPATAKNPAEPAPREPIRDTSIDAPTSARPVVARTSAPDLITPPPAATAFNDLLVDPSVELTPERKEAEMARIRERALACVKCPHLAGSRRHVVFGVGSVHAELMFVGEAPGMDEDEQGEPFVGKAGQLLTKIIQTMGLSREQVYIANVLKCRPDTPGQSTGNRPPTADEMNTCKPYLLAQVSVIRPKAIVALGTSAINGLLGKNPGIMRLRGRWQDFNGVPLMPTFHPAYLLRNQALTEKRKVWEDMLAVMERLALPISDKQRGFFLAK